MLEQRKNSRRDLLPNWSTLVPPATKPVVPTVISPHSYNHFTACPLRGKDMVDREVQRAKGRQQVLGLKPVPAATRDAKSK